MKIERIKIRFISRAYAFTLAEVLITLGIIGVVAAMTIPTLINKTQDAELKVSLKRNFSIFSEVYSKAVAENGSFQDSLSECSDGGHDCFKDVLKQHLKYTKECSNGTSLGNCFPSAVYQMNGVTASSAYANNVSGLILADGTLVDIYLDKADCSLPRSVAPFNKECGWVSIDVNGLKKPNMWGKDIYVFLFYDDKIRPQGEVGCGWETCNTSNGYGCAAKYLYNL